MHYQVVEAKHVEEYRVWVRFRDGRAGLVDLEDELVGPMLEPLRDVERFKAFVIHPEFHTLTWPNGADIAPELMRLAGARAAKYGLHQGDIIAMVDRVRVRNVDQNYVLSRASLEPRIELVLWRDNRYRTIATEVPQRWFGVWYRSYQAPYPH